MKEYSNLEIAQFLKNIGIAHEIKEEGFFRIQSYYKASETVLTYPKSVFKMWQEDPKSIDFIPGIGPAILEKLDYLFSTGQTPSSVEKILSGISPNVFVFEKINGIGPKIAHKLCTHLEFSDDPLKALSELIEYAKSGKIQTLPNLKEKTEQLILLNTQNFIGIRDRIPLQDAQKIADNFIKYFYKKYPDLEIYPLGSLRRKSSTIGDIDLAIKTDIVSTHELLNYFVESPDCIQIIIKGEKKASILIENNIRIDLMIQPSNNFGSLLQHFTGSKNHNINLRKHSLSLGLSMSEYGIKNVNTGEFYEFDSEEKVYNFLGLNYIKPEDRLGENEIDNAKK